MSGITGTGLKKCIPTKRARRGSPTAAASVSIEIERRVRGEDRAGRRDARRGVPTASRLTAGSSNTASTTRSASAARPGSSVATRRPRVASRSAAWSLPFATARSRLPAIRSRPACGPREVRLVQDDLLADRGVDLGDAVAHQAGAGDEDALDAHPVLLGVVATGYAAGCGTTTSRERADEQDHAAPRTATTRRHEEDRRVAGAGAIGRGTPARARTRGRGTGSPSRRPSRAPSPARG